MNRKSMSIECEFLAGTSLEDAVTEAKEMAMKLDIAYVKFNFNATKFSIGRNADVEEAKNLYHKDISFVVLS